MRVKRCAVRGNMLEWIASPLEHRTRQVVFNGQTSSLICIYNDLPTSIQSTARLLVNDTIVYQRIKKEVDKDILQVDLGDLQKCACTPLSYQLKPIHHDYTLDGKQLPVVDSATE